MSNVKVVWFSGLPSHYMSELHTRLENKFENIYFVYTPPEIRGIEFSHEKLSLPRNSILLPFHSSYIRAWKTLNHFNPRAVFISGNYPRTNLIAAFWAKLKNRELHYLSDSNILDIKNIKRGVLNQFFLKRLFLLATKLWFIGTRNKDFYISVCGSLPILRKLHYFPLPHLCDNFEKNPTASDSLFTFLMLGRLVDVKAFDKGLYAFSQLAIQERKRSQILIAGDGPQRASLERLASLLGISQSVIFLGSIASDKVPDIFARAHVVLVPSNQEPWGLVVNEALSSARPVIAPYWIGSAPDLIHDKETGILLADNSPDSILNAMQYCLDHPDLVTKMGLSGQKLIREGGWSIFGSIDSISRIINGLNNGVAL